MDRGTRLHRTARRAGINLLAVAMCVATTLTTVATAPGPAAAAGPAPAATGLTVEGVAGALGIDTPAPRLGWLVSSPQRGVTQSAYQIRVASTAAKLSAGKADVWDSGRTAGAESTQVPYGGPALA